MDESVKPSDLANQSADYVATAAKAALGFVPFIGSVLVELAGSVIPNQRIDRIVRFAQHLASRLEHVEQGFVSAQLKDENFTDLMEEGLRQAARSVMEERRKQIATLIANSLRKQDVSYVESKHLLRILGEINDIEVIWLASYYYDTPAEAQEYRARHSAVLEPVTANFGSSQEKVDGATLQQSYLEHLARLGLLQPRYDMDHGARAPRFDLDTGEQRVMGYRLSRLGRLLLGQLGILKNENLKE
ncbi:MAG: hypothetical protein LAP85_27370 [Acidobacteriia bacterium]|nr:hypothetical protein [Terriglobia bacterium]